MVESSFDTFIYFILPAVKNRFKYDIVYKFDRNQHLENIIIQQENSLS